MYASSHTSLSTQLTSIAPTTFPAVYMDGNQMLCSLYVLHMLTIFPHTTFYHTIDCSIGFPPYFTVTNIQHV